MKRAYCSRIALFFAPLSKHLPLRTIKRFTEFVSASILWHSSQNYCRETFWKGNFEKRWLSGTIFDAFEGRMLLNIFYRSKSFEYRMRVHEKYNCVFTASSKNHQKCDYRSKKYIFTRSKAISTINFYDK